VELPHPDDQTLASTEGTSAMTAEETSMIARGFVDFYHSTFSSARRDLAVLYAPDAVMTYAGTSISGAANIVEHLADLPIGIVTLSTETLDAQPLSAGGYVILVTASMTTDDEQMHSAVSELFVLEMKGSASCVVKNHIFQVVFK
jgi:hypothetical protein